MDQEPQIWEWGLGMDCLTWMECIIVTYVLVYLVAFYFLDCDLGLAWAEKFGKKVSSLKGKVVWVTGASSGIGEHLALSLARGGAKLVLSARRENELQRVKQKCLDVGSTLSNEDVLVLPLDITAFEKHEQSFQKVIDYFGSLDVLVNNAGRSQRALWENIDLDVDRQMFELNVFGVVHLTRVAVRYFMKEKGGEGHVAVTSSVAGIQGVPFSATYTATKHAIHGYFNSLRMEKLNSKIEVTILCPGPTFSNFLGEAFTEKPGEKFDQQTSPTDRRLTGERCGDLCAVAIANKLHEAWMGVFPLLPLMYLFVYYPNAGRLVSRYLGAKFFLKLRDSKESMKTE